MIRRRDSITLLLIFIVIFISILVICLNGNYSGLPLVVVPVIYGLFFILFAKIHSYYFYPGMFVLNVICLFRYLILPLLISIDPSYYHQTMLIKGIPLYLYEELCLGLFLILITNKYYRKISISSTHLKRGSEELSTNTGWVFKIITIIAIVIVIANPASLRKFNFIFTARPEEIYKYGEVVSGISSMILDWTKRILPLLLACYFINQYRRNEEEKFYYATILIILFFNLMIFTGISRNSAIIPGVASLFLILKIFPKKKKRTFLLVSVILVLAFIALTIFKNSYIGVYETYTLSSFTAYLESYFAGPRNLGYAILADNLYGSYVTFETFLNDIFASAPGISNYFDLENRTTTYYNLAFHFGGASRDAIIPTIGQGFIYFGYVFCFIPNLLFVWLMTQFDRQFWNATNIIGAFFMAYFAVRFGVNPIQNISIISGYIFGNIIPIMVLLYVDHKLFRSVKRNSLVNEKTVICVK